MISEGDMSSLSIAVWYPEMIVEKVPDDEVFVVEEVFYIRPIGFLRYAFSVGGASKWFVLKSSEGTLYPVLGEDYDS